VSGGFVFLWRSVQNSGVYRDSAAFHVFVHCLLEAAYGDRTHVVNGVRLKLAPGEFAYGRNTFAKALGLPSSTVRNAMKRLQKQDMLEDISSDMKEDSKVDTSKISIYKIKNWEKYQGGGQLRGQQTGHVLGQQTGQDVDTSTYIRNKENKGIRGEPALPDAFPDGEAPEGFVKNRPIAVNGFQQWIYESPAGHRVYEPYSRGEE
jgi:hypothetical protein